MTAKTRKTSKTARKPKGVARKLTDDAKIKVLVEANPHRTGTNDFSKFKKVAAAGTVGKARAAGVDSGYLRYAVARGIFAVG